MTRKISPPTLADMMAKAPHQSLEAMVADAFKGMRPASRMTVVEAAEAHTRVGGEAGRSTPWTSKKTPYLREPMNVLTSLDYQGMIFVGPARTGKTAMSYGWITHTVLTDPADMMFVNMDRENARKWSKGDLDRFLQASPDVRKLQITRRSDDNTFDKTFKNGIRLLITYPTGTNLSGITVGRVMFNDYDRNDDNVDGEGNAYDLGAMRTTTYKRFAMTAAESSPNPNKQIKDPRWISPSPHAAPPIPGIFELYNRGDRRRYHWCCPQCEEWFEPDFRLLQWGAATDPLEAREATFMVCPKNGCVIPPSAKDDMNEVGQWVKDWEHIPAGAGSKPQPLPGHNPARSTMASFWLKGPAAGYQDWGQLVEKYLRAMKAMDETGDDSALRKTVTTDQGTYYIPQSRLSDITPEDLMGKAEDWGSEQSAPTVPAGVRVLVGTVDVQERAFVCQVTGVTESLDLVVIDAFKIRLSDRINERGEKLPIEPRAYGEDWDTMAKTMLSLTYPLADGSGRQMQIRAVASDSGGGQGATVNAYALWRRLKARGDGSHQRFVLLKGEPKKEWPMARTTWPDSSQKDKFATARGDVPVVLLNSNTLKDAVNLMLMRRVSKGADEEGARSGMIRFPNWLESWFYVQMTTEIRTEKGWENPRSRRNESFDLTYYALGMIYRPVERGIPYVHFGLDRLDRENPPVWFKSWDENPLVIDPAVAEKDRPATGPQQLSFAEMAKRLA